MHVMKLNVSSECINKFILKTVHNAIYNNVFIVLICHILLLINIIILNIFIIIIIIIINVCYCVY